MNSISRKHKGSKIIHPPKDGWENRKGLIHVQVMQCDYNQIIHNDEGILTPNNYRIEKWLFNQVHMSVLPQ